MLRALAVLVCALGLTAELALAAYPGRNGRIAVDGYTEPRYSAPEHHIWHIRPDGTAPRRVGPGPQEPGGAANILATPSTARPGAGSRSPRTSGTAAAATSGRRGPTTPAGAGSWTIRADGTGLRRLTTDSRNEELIDWAPDGSRIALSYTPPGEVVTIGAGGSGRRLVAHGAGPAYSPDGRWILFYYGGALVRVRPDTGAMRIVRDRDAGVPRIGGQPSWQPR